jgi:hypothetical protein
MSGLPLFNEANNSPFLAGDSSGSLVLASLLADSVSITKSLTVGKPGDQRTNTQLQADGAVMEVWVPVYLQKEVFILGGLSLIGNLDILGNLSVHGQITVDAVGPAGVLAPPAGNITASRNLEVTGTSDLEGIVTVGTGDATGLLIVGAQPASASANRGVSADGTTGTLTASDDLIVGTLGAAGIVSITLGNNPAQASTINIGSSNAATVVNLIPEDAGAAGELNIGTNTTLCNVGFFGQTAQIQLDTGVGAAAFAAGTSAIADDTATFGGYTVGQMVQALQDYGLLA